MPFDFEAFLLAYTRRGLWESKDDMGDPISPALSAGDLAPETADAFREDCKDFADANADDLRAYCARMHSDACTGEGRAGHDFWLTRNGHGAGFWDRGLGELGDRLSGAARAYGSADLYVGDDGQIYQG